MNKLDLNILKKICDTPSPSTNEEELTDYLTSIEYNNFTSKANVDNSVSVISNTSFEKTVLLDAHMDQVHVRVVKIMDTGELVVKSIGFDMDVLLGNSVIHKKTGLKGIIGPFPPHLRIGLGPNDNRIGYCDLGMNVNDVEDKVEPGDVLLFDSGYALLTENIVTAPGLDNKINVFTQLEILDYFDKNINSLKYNLIVHFSTREEIGMGSFSDTLHRSIDYIIVLDASPSSDQIGVPRKLVGEINLGDGPIITRNYEDTYRFGLKLRDIGREHNIFPQLVFSSGYGASNSATYSKFYNSMVQYIGTPIRYIHSPYEMTDLNDTKQVKELVIRFLQE